MATAHQTSLVHRYLVALAFINALQLASGVTCSEKRTHCSASCLDTDGTTEKNMCRCDPHCALYGDCCIDFWTNCVNNPSPESRLRPILHSEYADYFGCVSPIDTELAYGRYVVVDRCPARWPQDGVRHQCENETLARNEKLYTLFVNGPGDVVFKNVYCTICHGIEGRHLKPWSLELWNCHSTQGGILLPFEDGKPNFDNCSNFAVEPPPSMPYDAHRCYSDVIDKCPVSASASPTQTRLCANHTSLIINKKLDVVFKNIHCLNCNLNSSFGNLDDVECLPRVHGNRYNPMHSFTLIFDFTDHKVHGGESSLVRGASYTSPGLGNCSHWQIYDPFADVCRDLSCPDGEPIGPSAGCTASQPMTSQSSQHCIQRLLPATSYDASTHEDAFWTLERPDDSLSPRRLALRIFSSFAAASDLQISLDRLLSNVTNPDQFTTVMCNATSVVLVASSQSDNPLKQTCQGYTFGEIAFADLSVSSAGVFSLNLSGVLYNEHEFVHETEFSFDLNESALSRRESVTLCSPFVGDRVCSQVILFQDDFHLSDWDDATFIHRESGLPFSSREVWQLPDGSLRVCRFEWVLVLAYVSYACSGCSTVAVILALVTYGIFPSLRNTAGRAVMNLMAAHGLAQLVLMVGTESGSWLCELRAAVLHFSWLAVFFWMSVLAFDLGYSLRFNVVPARRVRHGDSDRWKVVKFAAYAWGGPAAIVTSCFLASRFPGDRPEWFQYGGPSCWIVRPFHSLLVFGLPITVNIIFNCCMFVFMIHTVVANHRRLVASHMAQNARSTVLICLKLGVVTGVTWSLFIAANLVQKPALWFISVVVNSLQGALIALIFLLKANVRKLWREKLARGRCHRRGEPAKAAPAGTSDERHVLGGVPSGLEEDPPTAPTLSSSCNTTSLSE